MRPLGNDFPRARRFFTADRRLKFDPDTGKFREGVIAIADEAGGTKELRYRRLGFRTALFECFEPLLKELCEQNAPGFRFLA